jgi:hypothetical protein
MTFCGQADPLFTGHMFNAEWSNIAIFPYLLSDRAESQIYTAGAGAFEAFPVFGDYETLGERFERLLGYVGAGIPRMILTSGTTPAQGTDLACALTDIGGTTAGFSTVGQFLPPSGGQPVSQAINNIAASDLGLVYVPGDGALNYRTRYYNYGLPTSWTLGEQEIPYEEGLLIDQDAQKIYNQAQITPLNESAAITANNLPSQTQAGVTTFTQTSYLGNTDPSLADYDPTRTNVQDVADWVVNTEGEASPRVSQVVVDAGGNPNNWPFILAVEVGDIVQVNRRHYNAPEISVTCMVLSLSRDLERTDRGVTASVTCNLVPYYGNILTLDDPTYGQLNGTNRIGY